MIPDVQKLINQSGNVSMDIFNTRLIKPPTSVLVFPLKVREGQGGEARRRRGVALTEGGRKAWKQLKPPTSVLVFPLKVREGGGRGKQFWRKVGGIG